MAQTNHERVGKALDLLNAGLKPFILRELQTVHGERAADAARTSLALARGPLGSSEQAGWDTQALLQIMWDQWNSVFRTTLGHAERSLVSELREVRNRWAHQQAFSTDDTYRALDSINRLLAAVSAPEATEVERAKQEILRIRFEEQARNEVRKGASAAVEGQPLAGLKPWREVITPHPDVASGRYQQAEFAADLGQVHRGDGALEYRDPREFYRRTYLTEGLRHLLIGALQRLANTGGDPVVELQTNFGGGKTHSMLALYHLFSGTPARELPGLEPVLQAAGIAQPPTARRAVLVGTALSPAQPRIAPDGPTIRTLWGELAWQLAGEEGYGLVADADRYGVSPGSDALRELFILATPCLVLIDEWVAYARQLYVHPDDQDKAAKRSLPGGSFEANMSFAQSLTEAAKAVPGTLVVASIPASDIETGGEGGREALSRLKNTFGRVESAWRPASAEEGFEIVRRRLFQDIPAPLYPARDAVVRAFAAQYRTQPSEFPSGVGEGSYERRMAAAYPIHPELFDRLYNDWSTLERFQRTRGVLRLMAAVIHTLWERQDGGLLILPATIPVDASPVQFELTRYLEDPWAPVIEKDVDGPASLPLQIDRENPNFGRYSAARRVARTLFLGSAPTLHMTNKGLEDRQVKLGCVQPGESVATFGDALRRLTDGATHLYIDGHRYWYSTQPSVSRLAQDRAAQQSADAVSEEIRRRLKPEATTRGDFARVHICPPSGSDIPDEREARLVVLDPAYTHTAKASGGPALAEAQTILNTRGSSPRLYRNTVVFLAPDRARLDELEQAVRQFLAWQSIQAERETLNLDPFQANQAKTKREQAESSVKARIPETYIWLLVPMQEDPQGPIAWNEYRLQGSDELAVRAAKKLVNEEFLITRLAGTRLRHELDRVPLWRTDHISLRDLAEYFAQYLYLPRLKQPDVLLAAVQDGVRSPAWERETFAYAERWDSERGRYIGLRTGELVSPSLTDSLLVKPAAARRQLDAEAAAARPAVTPAADATAAPPPPATYMPGIPGQEWPAPARGVQEPLPLPPAVPTARDPHRFYGTVRVPATRLSRDVGTIAQEVIQHLAALVGAEVEITLDIRATLPDGAPPQVVRTVTENCRTLGFQTYAFEEE
ncbi:MAG TPA: Swt1 family HEPN domain-containing protein [Chloroflexia bacterium]|nr:Swt1 family HEPN domain-containing protein [Chloroflexia bacterium]